MQMKIHIKGLPRAAQLRRVAAQKIDVALTRHTHAIEVTGPASQTNCKERIMKTVIGKSRISKDAMPAALIDEENGADLDDRLQRIATAAYYRAEARGFVPGLEVEDWVQAEAEVDAPAEQ